MSDSKIQAVLTSFRFSKSEFGSYIEGNFKDEAGASYSANFGDQIPFEFVLKSKTFGIPWFLIPNGEFTNRSGETQTKYKVLMGTI